MNEELKNLKELVGGSAEYTKSQLQSIDSNLFIGSMFSLLVSFGISIFFNLLIYWIPSSFFLMFIWGFYSFISQIRKKNNTIINFQELNSKQKYFQSFTFFKNFFPLQYSISIIFAISLILLVLFSSNTIKTDIQFNMTIPIISIFLIFIIFAFISRTINALHNKESSFFDVILDLKDIPSAIGCKKACFILLFSLIFVFVIFLVLPIWSVICTYPIYGSSLSKAILMLIVIIIQFLMIIAFSCYFSSISLKSELTNTLTNFSIIDNLINEHLLKKNIDETAYKDLLKLFYQAKRFEFSVDNTFIFVNFYYLLINKVFYTNLK